MDELVVYGMALILHQSGAKVMGDYALVDKITILYYLISSTVR
jgi:hypothetical protein